MKGTCFGLVFAFALLFFTCNKNKENATLVEETVLTETDSLKLLDLQDKAIKYGIFSKEYQEFLSLILKKDSENAGLWQQKAMPLFKAKKYELGMQYLDKAVLLNPKDWLSYRAFIKCIFSKQYKESIKDFNKVKLDYGDSHVMDHTYDFYLGLCYLQLNEFKKANQYLKQSYETEQANFSEAWISPIDSFYLGISYLEIDEFQLAILNLNKALKEYPTFGDAHYYKYLCFLKQDKNSEAKTALNLAYANILEGNTVNEANSFYEKYPYQVYLQQLEYLVENP